MTDLIARFMTAALKGYLFLATRRDAVSAIYDASVKVMTRDGMAEEKVLEAVIDEPNAPRASKRKFGRRIFSISAFYGRRESS